MNQQEDKKQNSGFDLGDVILTANNAEINVLLQTNAGFSNYIVPGRKEIGKWQISNESYLLRESLVECFLPSDCYYRIDYFSVLQMPYYIHT